MKKLSLVLTTTTKLLLKLSFKLDLKLLYFFSDNLVGYLFYIFCIFYGFFGCQSENCDPTHLVAMLFSLFMMGLMIQTYILLKIPYTRDYLQNLVGKEYIEQYLGKYSGSAAIGKLFKYVGPAIAIGTVEAASSTMESNRCLKAAHETEENFKAKCEFLHKLPTEAEYMEMEKVRDGYIRKSTEATGVVSKSFAAAKNYISSKN